MKDLPSLEERISELEKHVRAASEEFDAAIVYHETWKPAAYDKELHKRVSHSYAGNSFLATRIVQQLEGPAVLLLDAPWGTGKSTFVKMWRGELNKRDIPTIYFDAFANDYHSDAFVALAGEIIAAARKTKPRAKAIVSKFTRNSVSVAKVLGVTAFNLGLRVATAGLMDAALVAEGISTATELGTKSADELAKAADKELERRLKSRNADRQAFDEFREALAELAKTLAPKSARTSTKPVTPAPLVFIIDELDRCRPTFALELLEKVKHFFAVPGVIFVLVASLEQLEKAVRYAYGNDIDANTYLEKFYHLRVQFPVGNNDRPDLRAPTYLRYLFSSVLTKGTIADLGDNVTRVITEFDQVHPLPLRTLERIGTYAALVNISLRDMQFVHPVFVACLCIMKVIAPELYDLARRDKLRYEDVEKLFAFSAWRTPGNRDTNSRMRHVTENWWRYVLDKPVDEKLRNDMVQRLIPYDLDDAPRRVVSTLCEVIDGFAFPGA